LPSTIMTTVALLVLGSLCGGAEEQPTAKPRVRDWDWKEDRAVAEANGWIWSGAEVDEAFRQAARSQKPLMVVLRCPP
jgi:hypothetical protein